jgi:hypothetical protein
MRELKICHMIFALYVECALAHDLPKLRLRRGDLVRLVEHHFSPNGEEGYSAEVLGAKGQTMAVIAVAAASLEALRDNEVLSVRSMTVYATIRSRLATSYL